MFELGELVSAWGHKGIVTLIDGKLVRVLFTDVNETGASFFSWFRLDGRLQSWNDEPVLKKREATVADNRPKIDLLLNKIKDMNTRIEGWSQQKFDLNEEIEKLNRWINLEQSDIDTANEMIVQLEKVTK